jgi:hypothetical protein
VTFRVALLALSLSAVLGFLIGRADRAEHGLSLALALELPGEYMPGTSTVAAEPIEVRLAFDLGYASLSHRTKLTTTPEHALRLSATSQLAAR